MCLLLLAVAAVRSGLRRSGSNADLYFRYVLPAIFLIFIILAGINNQRLNQVVSSALLILVILSILFWLITLTNKSSHSTPEQTLGDEQKAVDETARPISYKDSASSTTQAETPKPTRQIVSPVSEWQSTSKIGLRKLIISTGIAIAAAMALFPPWIYRSSYSGRIMGRWYSSLFWYGEPHPAYYLRRDTIDLTTLFVQWCLVTLVTAGAVYLVRGRDISLAQIKRLFSDKPQPPASSHPTPGISDKSDPLMDLLNQTSPDPAQEFQDILDHYEMEKQNQNKKR